MSEKTSNIGFEQKLEMLEALVKKMESGNMKLDELLDEYATAMRILKELSHELDAAQAKMLILKEGLVKPAEDKDGI